MISRTMVGLSAATLFALALGTAMPAAAAPAACADKMAGDGMMKDDKGMAKDAMADDKMADDGMMKDDDGMAKDAMADGKMADDGMMKDGGGMMMADYTVKKGDSLWEIAAATLCDGAKYPEIVAANPDAIGSDMMVVPGQVLHIPGD